MSRWQRAFIFLGRISIGILFIFLAIDKILNWQEAEKELLTALGNWQGYTSTFTFLQSFFNMLLEWVPATLLFFSSLQLLGGILLFFNIKTKFGAFFLAVITFFITLIYYPFWLWEIDMNRYAVNFFKNLGILGGLLYILGSPKKKRSPLPIKPPKIEKPIIKK